MPGPCSGASHNLAAMLTKMAMPADGIAKTRILRRLRWLRNWELVNVFLLPAVFIWLWIEGGGAVSWQLRVPALVMVSYLLAQGTLYWHLKIESVQERSALPASFCRTFRTLGATSLLGFALVIGVIALSALRGHGDTADFAWAAGLLTFAALEYINYYHRQLMHDTAADWAYLRRYRRLRRAPLAVDIERSCAGTGGR